VYITNISTIIKKKSFKTSNKHRLSHATKMVLLFLQVNFPARALVIMSRQTLGWLCVQPSFEWVIRIRSLLGSLWSTISFHARATLGDPPPEPSLRVIHTLLLRRQRLINRFGTRTLVVKPLK